MDDTIVMVPWQVKNIHKPVAKWIFSIGILRAIYMQAQINANKQITKIAELMFSVGDNEKDRKNKRQGVFE